MDYPEVTPQIIEGLLKTVLWRHLDDPQPTPKLHREIWSLCCDTHPWVAAAAPRFHAKSTAVTWAYTLARVLFRKSKYVIIVSATEPLAIEHLRGIKNVLMNNKEVKDLFRIDAVEKDNETDIIVRMTDGHKFRIRAKGSEQRLRGILWENKRPDLIIGDDLEEDEQVENEERREKFRYWFFKTLLPCLSKNGIIRIVGTILHFDSLLMNLIKNNSWKSKLYEAHDDNFENILWPEAWSKDKLMKMRAMYENQGMLEAYAQEMRNRPFDDSTAFFKKQDLLPMEEDDFLYEKEYYIGVDLAISEKDKSAFTAFVIVGIDSTGMWYVENVIRERMDSLSIIETFFTLHSRYNPLFCVESENIEKSLGPIIQEEMNKRNTYLSIEKRTPSRDKRVRARPIQARIRAHGVKFDTKASWWIDFKEELIGFDKWPYRDQVDAFAWIGLILNKVVYGRTPEEIEEDEYQDLLLTANDLMGRSSVTGY